MRCLVCTQNELRSDDEKAMETCTECANTLGLRPMPPLTRPSRPCLRCNGMEFLRVIPREHSSKRGGEQNKQVSAPMFLTHAPTTQNLGIFSADLRADAIPIEQPGLGAVEIFTCRGCGFIEWYCPDVQSVPARPALMTEIVNYAGDKPYR